MEDSRRAKQALHWIPDKKRKQGRPCISWDTLRRHIKCMQTPWDDICLKAMDREEWKQWTA